MSLAFEVHIATGNGAFHLDDDDTFAPGRELADILRGLADRIEDGVAADDVLRLHDSNGNRVGFAVLQDAAPVEVPR